MFSIAEFSLSLLHVLEIPVVPPLSIHHLSVAFKNIEAPIHKLGGSLIFSVLREYFLLFLVKISAYSVFF